jgi:hypothetical protein
MSILARYANTNLTAEKYEEANRRLAEAGLWPDPDGLELHVCFESEGSLRVSEVWESQEKMDAYGEKLMPLLADVGIEFSGAPEILDVHNIVKH